MFLIMTLSMPKILPKYIIYQIRLAKYIINTDGDNMRFFQFLRFLISTRYSRRKYKKFEKYLDDLREE